MLIILSPAKTMDMTGNTGKIPSSKPLYEKEAEMLADKMRQYSIEELEILLKVSKSLVEENYHRYQQFSTPSNPVCQAILAYNGSVFKAINASSFSEADFYYAQDHLRIISTMYGLVRPLDMIEAYRLAYPLKLKGMEGKNLYEFWLPQLTDNLIKDVQKAGGVLVNLASLDVLGALKMEELRSQVRLITPEFQEYRNGKYETIRTYAKQARGAMARYILLNQVESQENLTGFKWDGFQFNENISDTEKYIFTRNRRK